MCDKCKAFDEAQAQAFNKGVALDAEATDAIYESFHSRVLLVVAESPNVFVPGDCDLSGFLARSYAKRCPRATVFCLSAVFFNIPTECRPGNLKSDDNETPLLFDLIVATSLDGNEGLEEEINTLTSKLDPRGRIEVGEFVLEAKENGSDTKEYVERLEEEESDRRRKLNRVFKRARFKRINKTTIGPVTHEDMYYTIYHRVTLFSVSLPYASEMSFWLRKAKEQQFKLVFRLFGGKGVVSGTSNKSTKKRSADRRARPAMKIGGIPATPSIASYDPPSANSCRDGDSHSLG